MPLVVRLAKWGFGKTISVPVVVTLAFSLIGVIGWLVTAQVLHLVDELPSYQQNLHAKVLGLKKSPGTGLMSKGTAMLKRFRKEVESLSPAEAQGARGDDSRLDILRSDGITSGRAMFAYLHGKLAEALPTQVTVEVNGIGYDVLIPLSSFDKLPKPGHEVKLLTHLIVREDAHVLYGFMTAEERELFRLLINTVSGIGPKIALNVLSGMNPTTFRGAVANSDVRALSQISGVGKKTAERMVVELRDKFGAAGAWQASSARHGLSPEEQKINDAVLALMALDYKQQEAHEVVRGAAAMLGPQASLEQLVRASLQKRP